MTNLGVTIVIASLALLVSTLGSCIAPLVALAQSPPRYTTAPSFAWTFDTDSTALPKYAGSSYTYIDSYASRQGAIALNGIGDFVQLRTHTDDLNRNFTNSTLGDSLSFEAWTMWTSFGSFMRVLDLGGPAGANDNNLMLGYGQSTTQLFFGSVVNNTLFAFVSPLTAPPILQWVHVAGTIRKLNSTTAEYKVYANGSQVGAGFGPVPAAVQRPSSYLGRSNWADSLFRGFIDSVLIYDYALDAEAIAAHMVVPRVPVYELTFGVDPRTTWGLNVATNVYDWSAGTAPHTGLLTLSNPYGVSFNLAASDGYSTVGTTLPAVIGGPGWPIATGDRVGWTFEMTFMGGIDLDLGENAAIKYIHVTLYSGLVMVNSSDWAEFVQLSYTLQPNVWYTFVLVMRPGSMTAWMNGVVIGSRNASILVTPLRSRYGYANVYGSLDSLRFYDYALSSNEVASLYQVVSGSNSSASPTSSSTGTWQSTGLSRSSSASLPSSSAPLPSSSAPYVPPSSSSSSSSSAPQPTPVVDTPRALSPRHGPTSSYDAAHVRAVSRELLDRPLSLTPLGSTPVDDGLYSWTLPFAFRVGSVTTSTVTVSTNGNLQFGGGLHSYRFVPEPLPKGDGELLPLLSYLFTDINVTSAAQFQVGVLGNTTNERVALLRVQAVGTALNRSAASSIDVLLFEGVNRIEVRYYSVGVFTERTLIALQNADAGDFAVFWNAEALTDDARALLSGSTIVFQPRVAFANGSGARRLRRRLLFAME